MPTLSRFSARGLALAAALVVPLAALLLTRAAFAPACDAARSPAEIAVYVDDERRGQFDLQRADSQGPIRVEPFQTVEIAATVAAQPDGCHDQFTVDWNLSFVAFEPRELRTTPIAPRGERLAITLGALRPGAAGEDRIVVVVRGAAGQSMRFATILLKGTVP